MEYILHILLFFPFIAIIGLLFVKKRIKFYAYTILILELGLLLFSAYSYDTTLAGMQFIQKYPLFKEYGIFYYIGVDSFSLFSLFITTFGIIIALTLLQEDEELKISIAILFLLEGLFVGVFIALDAALFYLFWELLFLPIIMGIIALGEKKTTIIFILYFLLSSLLLFVSFALIANNFYHKTKIFSFAFVHWYALVFTQPLESTIFTMLVIALVLKIPFIPFYSWSKRLFFTASSSGSFLLVTVMVFPSLYALVRIVFPIFPLSSFESFPIIALFAFAIIITSLWRLYKSKNLLNFLFYKSFFALALVFLYFFYLDTFVLSSAFFLFFIFMLFIAFDFYLIEKNSFFLGEVHSFFLLFVSNLLFSISPLIILLPLLLVSKESYLALFGISALLLGVFFLLSLLFVWRLWQGASSKGDGQCAWRSFVLASLFLFTLPLASSQNTLFIKPLYKSGKTLIDFMHKKANRSKAKV